MKKIQFINPEFHLGWNCTVRRGLRWSKLKIGEEINLVKTLGGKSFGIGIVIKILVCRFGDLEPWEIKDEHALHCQWRPDILLKDMKEIYNGFKSSDVITVVYFDF